MTPTDSNQRLYLRFITTLKIIQYLGYFIVVLFGAINAYASLFSAGLSVLSPISLAIVLQVAIGCVVVYLITQGLMAVIDLLSRIERNTRSM